MVTKRRQSARLSMSWPSDGRSSLRMDMATTPGWALGPGGHGLQAGQPVVGVEEARVVGQVARGLVPPAVAVGEVAAPAGLADVVVQHRHDAALPQRVDDGAVHVARGGAGQERVLGHGGAVHAVHAVGRHAGLGRHAGEGVRHQQPAVERVVDRVRQPHAVEALAVDPVGQERDRLLVQALGHLRLHVAGPVDAAQLDALAAVVDDPPARRVQRQRLAGPPTRPGPSGARSPARKRMAGVGRGGGSERAWWSGQRITHTCVLLRQHTQLHMPAYLHI